VVAVTGIKGTGGMMCPTYRAVNEENLSTRGRANMLRSAMNGTLDADATDTEFLTEVMDLCIGCKPCPNAERDGVDGPPSPLERISRHLARASTDECGSACTVYGWDIVLIEPSDAVMFQSDYLDLLAGRDVERVAANTYGVMEYLEQFELASELPVDDPEERLTYHGHCHQKATPKDAYARQVLETVGYEVDELDSGCCGMVGLFGHETEHYSLSRKIGAILFDQVEHSDGDTVVAPGASCRTQLSAYDGCEDPPHPIEKIASVLS
jgi:Fe-S oxidoreductase